MRKIGLVCGTCFNTEMVFFFLGKAEDESEEDSEEDDSDDDMAVDMIKKPVTSIAVKTATTGKSPAAKAAAVVSAGKTAAAQKKAPVTIVAVEDDDEDDEEDGEFWSLLGCVCVWFIVFRC